MRAVRIPVEARCSMQNVTKHDILLHGRPEWPAVLAALCRVVVSYQELLGDLVLTVWVTTG